MLTSSDADRYKATDVATALTELGLDAKVVGTGLEVTHPGSGRVRVLWIPADGEFDRWTLGRIAEHFDIPAWLVMGKFAAQH